MRSVIVARSSRGLPAAHLWTWEGQAPIVLLDGQVLFFNHGAALAPSIAIIQLPEFWLSGGLNMQGLLNVETWCNIWQVSAAFSTSDVTSGCCWKPKALLS